MARKAAAPGELVRVKCRGSRQPVASDDMWQLKGQQVTMCPRCHQMAVLERNGRGWQVRDHRRPRQRKEQR